MVTIPANSSATVYVPAKAVEDVKEGGQALVKAQGVRVLRVESGRVICEVQSGAYQFETNVGN
jgi:alpha-L-rhamnosidase